ncbi:MAG: hypothetical protein QOE34_540 [Verrucomicrobiota bacterium]|jgi:hypothetical integral membrane protein (TIGR02206 family)
MEVDPAFRAFGPAHLVVIALTIALPFVLAAFVRKTRWPRCERIVGRLLAALLLVNYLGYEIYLGLTAGLSWEKALPFQLCDWAMIAIIVALLTGRERWLEVAYFWGIGGTAQAILTPDLKYAFPDIRFLSFFIAHSGIVIGIAFVMIMRGFRPHISSIWRTFAWSELYFVLTIAVDSITGVNYGYLLHKPEASSLLSYLSDQRALYIFQMHLLALAFFCALYLPFAFYDLVTGNKKHA